MDPVAHFDPLPSDEPLHIRLKPGSSPPKMHRYRCPDHLLPEFKKFVDEMADKGWLSPSDSEWAAPILIIKKPGTYEDGSSKGFRFVSDFRKLNEVVKPLQHHMPDLTEMWEKLRDANYISVCDMKHGFWNAPISEASRKYVSVNTPWGAYSYNCVPMGLVNSSAYFQRWLSRKLKKHGILYEPISVSTTPDSELNDPPGFTEGLEGDKDAKPKSAKRSRKSGNGKNKSKTYKGFVSIYQDDIIVFSQTEEEHRAHLLLLFKVLSEEHIPLNIKKSHLFCRFVRYLGCVVGNKHLYLDPSKCDSIHKMTVKKDVTSIRGFLGLTGFYRRWIKNYADKARHLNDMLKKDVDIDKMWGKEQDSAVNKLKLAVTSYPVLRQPMLDRPWVIACDASIHSMGASIGQMVDGKMTVTAYCSRAFHGPEKNYPIQHKEALALVFAIEKFNHYILGCPHFEVRMWTDHQSLQFMKNQKDLAGRMARWAMKLANYRCTIKYLKGPKNVVADALSRLITVEDCCFDNTQSLLSLYPEWQMLIARHFPRSGAGSKFTGTDEDGQVIVDDSFLSTMSSIKDFSEDNFTICDSPYAMAHEQLLFNNHALNTTPTTHIVFNQDNYLKCEQFGTIYKALHPDFKEDLPEKDLNSVKRRIESFFIENNTLLFHSPTEGEVICVPNGNDGKEGNNFRTRIIKELHSSEYSGHRGISGTHLNVRRRFYWPKIHKDVQLFIAGCEECCKNKSNRQQKQGKLQPLPNPFTPGTHYSLDFKTDLPESGPGEDSYNQILVCVDRFSKRVWLIPTRKRSSSLGTAELFLNNIVSKRGLPLDIVSDRDIRFTSNFWRSLWKLTGTTLTMSTSRHQNTDGQSEITIRIVEEMLRSVINYRQDNWVSKLPMIEFALNNTVSSAHGLTPFVCETGRNPITPLDYILKSNHGNSELHDNDTDLKSKAHLFLQDISSAHAQARDQLMIARDRMIRFADRRRSTVKGLSVGGKCYLKLEGIDFEIFKRRPNKKLGNLWFGPFEILEQISPVSYKLDLPHNTKIHPVFHVDRLKAFSTTQDLTGVATRLPPVKDDVYVVEAILDERVRYRKREFLIHWQGYSELFDSTWEPESELNNAKAVVKRWRRTHKALPLG